MPWLNSFVVSMPHRIEHRQYRDPVLAPIPLPFSLVRRHRLLLSRANLVHITYCGRLSIPASSKSIICLDVCTHCAAVPASPEESSIAALTLSPDVRDLIVSSRLALSSAAFVVASLLLLSLLWLLLILPVIFCNVACISVPKSSTC